MSGHFVGKSVQHCSSYIISLINLPCCCNRCFEGFFGEKCDGKNNLKFIGKLLESTVKYIIAAITALVMIPWICTCCYLICRRSNDANLHDDDESDSEDEDEPRTRTPKILIKKTTL